MAIPLSNYIITPLHHLHASPSLPLPTTTLRFSKPPLSQNSKRLTLATSTKTFAASTTEPTLRPEGDEDLDDKIKEDNISKVAERWRELHGERDWEGLLDPMDPLLKSEVIKYGDMAQACYDAFDYDLTSRYCGSSKYSRTTFFSDLGLPYTGYDITSYLYATFSDIPNFFRRSAADDSWSPRANWIGYVAVSNDETSQRIGRRDIVVAWRGTVTKLEWVADMTDYLVEIPGHPKSGLKVESGFLKLYTEKAAENDDCKFSKYSVREQVLAELWRLVRYYSASNKEEVSITVTGHSLGAAMAVLSGYDIVEKGVNGEAPVTVFSFAGPRVGNREFKEAVEASGVKVLRVVNVHDVVPKVPGMLVNEKAPALVRLLVDRWLPWFYSHVGVELALDHRRSPFLKDTLDPASSHNLEAYLHLLDGYRGKGLEFMQSIGRDIALVNKASDFLKHSHLVPPSWRQDENKGMTRDKDGRWIRIQPERPRLDGHRPEMEDLLKQIGFI